MILSHFLQFEFLMSVAEGAPELLSQVKEQIIAGTKRLAHDVDAKSKTVLPQRDSTLLNVASNLDEISPIYPEHFQRKRVTSKWPPEPMINIQNSLQEWVRFAELLENESANYNFDSNKVNNFSIIKGFHDFMISTSADSLDISI